MAGIDLNNVYPNSKMAKAAKLGQSLFRSVESVTVAAPVGLQTMTAIAPSTSVSGQPPELLRVRGTNFTETSVIEIDGNPQPTTFISDTEVSTTMPPSVTVREVTSFVPVLVNTDGSLSNALDFIVTAPPVLTSLETNPTIADPAGAMKTLLCIGTDFTASSVIYVNDVACETTYSSSKELATNQAGRTSQGSWPVFVRTGSHDTAVINWSFDTIPILNTHGPDPAPVGTGTFGFSLTGNFFKDGMVAHFDGVPVQTDVYSQWSITGNAPMRSTPGVSQFTLVFDGVGYVPTDWTFAELLPTQSAE